jgi:nitronate monooxygenase
MRKTLDSYELRIGNAQYKPLVIGGMGVDISTKELALAAADMGAVGHISDAMITAVADRHLGSDFVSKKLKQNRQFISSGDKSDVHFDLEQVREATRLYTQDVMKDKTGRGAVFANCMEKLTMNDDKHTLKARLDGLLDGGIDGITLSAGLHMGSFALMENHPRFREAKLGIIVSSARALRIFLLKSKKTARLPDYVIVEGPLAGGHLGFCEEDISRRTLEDCLLEVLEFLKTQGLDIPVIAAGGIFTGQDAVNMIRLGASGIQVATRFTVAEESGLPYKAKQAYIKAEEEDIVILGVSPTGYPMRLLRQSPALDKGIRPNCEAFGYLLSNGGVCPYLNAYLREKEKGAPRIAVHDKICMCSAMRNYQCWTCGSTTHRIKDTLTRLPNGDYVLPRAEEIIEDYLYNIEEQETVFNVSSAPRPSVPILTAEQGRSFA